MGSQGTPRVNCDKMAKKKKAYETTEICKRINHFHSIVFHRSVTVDVKRFQASPGNVFPSLPQM